MLLWIELDRRVSCCRRISSLKQNSSLLRLQSEALCVVDLSLGSVAVAVAVAVVAVAVVGQL